MQLHIALYIFLSVVYNSWEKPPLELLFFSCVEVHFCCEIGIKSVFLSLKLNLLVLASSPQLDFSTIFTLRSLQGFKQSLLILETILRVSGCELSPLDSKHPLQLFPQKEAEKLTSLEAFTLSYMFTLSIF